MSFKSGWELDEVVVKHLEPAEHSPIGSGVVMESLVGLTQQISPFVDPIAGRTRSGPLIPLFIQYLHLHLKECSSAPL
jgi:hypothetical protein